MYETSACGINMKCEFHHPNSLRTLDFGNLTNLLLYSGKKLSIALMNNEGSTPETWKKAPVRYCTFSSFTLCRSTEDFETFGNIITS